MIPAPAKANITIVAGSGTLRNSNSPCTALLMFNLFAAGKDLMLTQRSQRIKQYLCILGGSARDFFSLVVAQGHAMPQWVSVGGRAV
jgi:hypothetical protein